MPAEFQRTMPHLSRRLALPAVALLTLSLSACGTLRTQEASPVNLQIPAESLTVEALSLPPLAMPADDAALLANHSQVARAAHTERAERVALTCALLSQSGITVNGVKPSRPDGCPEPTARQPP